MDLEYHSFILVLLAGFMISAAISFLSLKQRKNLLTNTFGILMLTITFWLLCAVFEYASISPDIKYLWIKAEYIFIIVLPVFWFIFTAFYTGRLNYTKTRFISFLLIIPIISLVMVWTNEWHYLMWHGYTIITSDTLSYVSPDRNIWFWVHSLYSYLLLFCGTFFLFQHYINADALHRKQAGSLLLGALIPWVSNIAFLILGGVMDFALDPTPISFSITGIIFFFSIAQLRLLDILPIARDAIIQSLDEGVFVLDREGRVIDMNPAALNMVTAFGSPGKELIGVSIAQLLPQLADILKKEEFHTARQFDFKYRQASQTRFFTASLSLIKDNVQQQGSLLIIRDTTQRVLADEIEREKVRLEIEVREKERTENVLRESEERYRTIFESANDINIIIDTKGRILDINDRIYDIIGYKRSDFIGQNIADLSAMIPVDMENRFLSFFTSVCKGKIEPPLIATVYKRDRTAAEVEFNAVPVYKNGEVQSVFTIARDLTQSRAAEKALLRLATAIEQSADAVLITDVTGAIQYVNPAFEHITGYTSEEVYSKTPRILKSGKQDDDFYAAMWRSITCGNQWSGNIINRKKDGTLYYERAHISPVFDESGDITNFVAIKRDVTSELEMENQLRQSQKMEAVGRLAGGVAHDFNNILTVISVCSHMLKESLEEDDERLTDVTEIVDATERAKALTKQLLAFSRHQRMEVSALNVNTVIKDIYKMLSRLIGENIVLELMLQEELWNVKADRSGIEQVIINLVVNARDAMPEGGKIVITTENINLAETDVPAIPEGEPGNFVRISVMDTGTGMTRDVIDHIFDPFYTTKERGKGTGLGLSTVYGIVRQSGGWVNVYSEPLKGASFRIYLPWLLESEKGPGNTDTITYSEDFQGKGEHILFVEDEEPIRRITEKMLKDNNYIVYSVDSAERALEICKRECGNLNLLLSDVVLPGMSGVELVEQVNEYYPELKIILSSGYADEKSQLEIIEKKGYKFIQKPYTPAILLRIIREIFTE